MGPVPIRRGWPPAYGTSLSLHTFTTITALAVYATDRRVVGIAFGNANTHNRRKLRNPSFPGRPIRNAGTMSYSA